MLVWILLKTPCEFAHPDVRKAPRHLNAYFAWTSYFQSSNGFASKMIIFIRVEREVGPSATNPVPYEPADISV